MTDRPTGIEDEAESTYIARQFKALIGRHPIEDVILVRVLTDHYQLVANSAKDGGVEEARRKLESLDAEIEVPADDEIAHAVRVGALPVWGLVHWLEGEAEEALECMHGALESAGRLTGPYGHDYLTPRRIYFGVNITRVLAGTRDAEGALHLYNSLTAVALGDRSRWPFSEPDSLDVPLEGVERELIGWHLGRVRSMVLSLETPAR